MARLGTISLSFFWIFQIQGLESFVGHSNRQLELFIGFKRTCFKRHLDKCYWNLPAPMLHDTSNNYGMGMGMAMDCHDQYGNMNMNGMMIDESGRYRV